MNRVSPAGEFGSIAKQKLKWVIQKTNKPLGSSENLQHPVNMQDQFSQKL